MKQLILYILLATASPVFACSCFYIDNFCEYVDDAYTLINGRNGDSISVATAVYLGFENIGIDNGYFPLYHYKINRVIQGAPISDTISLHGQDGLNCNGYEEKAEGTEVLLWTYVYQRPYIRFNRGIDTVRAAELNIYGFPGCGPSSLLLEDGIIKGPVAPNANEVKLEDFVDDLPFCFDGLSVGVGEGPDALNKVLSCVPNPVQDQLTVSLGGNSFLDEIAVYDATGRRFVPPVSRVDIASLTVDVSALPAGIYIVRVSDGRRTGYQRVVVR